MALLVNSTSKLGMGLLTPYLVSRLKKLESD